MTTIESSNGKNNSTAALEALLFIYGEPVDAKKATKLLGISAEEFAVAVAELKKELASEGRGLTLVEHEGSVQIATKPQFSALLGTVLKAEMHEALSPASLETLSIVTYAGPIGRAEIDYIRGVNSSFTLRALLLRGLIDRDTDPERANAYRYKPSVELLHHLGVSSINELPEFERFRTLVATLKQPQTPAGETATTETATQTS
jgi:segregation and condensation protein B